MARRTAARLGSIAAGALLILAWTTESFAEPITVPTGLNPGEQYRLAFVTSTTRDATSTDIEDYNAFVTAVAESVPDLLALGTTWTTIGSTSTVDARDNTNTNPDNAVGVPIYLLNGTLLVDDNSDLWDGVLGIPLGIDEQGNTSESDFVWTGTDVGGTADVGIIGFAGFELGSTPFVVVGDPYTEISLWINRAPAAPTVQAGFYAISNTLTVTPEPTTALLLAAGLAGLAAAGQRRSLR